MGRPPPSHSCRTLFYPLMALLVPIWLPILSQTVFQEWFFIWVKWGSEAVRMTLPVLSRTRYLSFFAVKTRVTAYTYIQNTWIMFLPSIFYKKSHFLYSLWCFCVHFFLSCSFYDPYGFTSSVHVFFIQGVPRNMTSARLEDLLDLWNILPHLFVNQILEAKFCRTVTIFPLVLHLKNSQYLC